MKVVVVYPKVGWMMALVLAALFAGGGGNAEGAGESPSHGPRPVAARPSAEASIQLAGATIEGAADEAPIIAQSSGPLPAESQDLKGSPCPLNGYGLDEPEMKSPVVPVEDFGAKGDGVTDDSEAISKAIRSLKHGGTVLFQPGKVYVKRKIVIVDGLNVALWGYGATIYAQVTPEEVKGPKGSAEISIRLVGDGTAVYGLTFVSNLRTRLVGHPNNSAVFVVKAKRARVVDNHFEYTGNGVLLEGAVDFLVARNVVYRTTADGIHVTQGSRTGRIICNLVRETGDDMIAVVNYGAGEPTIGDFLIQANDIGGQYSGRGITVVGGKDITIRRNKISDTPHGAGILINSEVSWKTANIHNVLIEENEITNCQTTRASYNPIKMTRRTGHGAIDINGQGKQLVTDVLVTGNSIMNAGRDGVLVRGTVCRIGIAGNHVTQVGRDAVRVESNSAGECQPGCQGNLLADEPVNPSHCDGAVVSVRGATLQ